MSYDTKLTNPKDHFGSAKIDVSVVPFTAIVGMARAFLEGALKYGRFNWRIAGVRSSIYYAAAERHLAKWWNGQNVDKATKIHHIESAMACLAIIRDAELYGKLNDDRPPCPDPDAMAKLIDDAAADVKHLKEMFKEHSPKQYTIADTSGPTCDVCGTRDMGVMGGYRIKDNGDRERMCEVCFGREQIKEEMARLDPRRKG